MEALLRAIRDSHEHHLQWDGFEDLVRMRDLMERSPSPDAEFQTAFALVKAAVTVADNAKPDRRKMDTARRAFFALPRHQRRRIFNGWPADRSTESFEHALFMAANNDYLRRVLVLSADEPESRADGLYMQVHGRVDRELACGTSPIHVEILEGTTREEAIRYLWVLSWMIRDNWPKLIGSGSAGTGIMTRMKNGTPAKASDPLPASKVDQEAREPMAV